MALLRLRDADGLTGLGEAVPLSLRGGTTLTQVLAELEGLGEIESLDEAVLRNGAAGLSAPARCAALTALLDLRGRRASAEHGESAAAPPPPIRCNATLTAGDPATVAAQAEQWATDGFTDFKLKLGTGDDVEQVRTVRDAVGPAARIRVDANATWSLKTARQVLAELEEFEIELAEQPVETIEEAAELAASTSIPIAADESVETRADAERALAAGACALTGIKLSKVGGPETAIEIAEVLPAYLSSALDGPVGIAAAAQVAATLSESSGGADSGLAHGLATQRLFASTIASTQCELRDGRLHPPEGPGLGVEIDEKALAAHRLDS
jgi:L-alanine-DL-glutamate epimerase-like enolase superfamily enzyme